MSPRRLLALTILGLLIATAVAALIVGQRALGDLVSINRRIATRVVDSR